MSKLPSISLARKAAAWSAASALAISPVADSEGLRLTPYYDVARVLTDCYGRTKGVVFGVRQTKIACDSYLAKDILAHAERMQKCVYVDVPVKSLVGLISFGYNVGSGAFCGSTLVRILNTGDLKNACDQLPRWNKAAGVVWKGLVTRRAWEKQQCLSGLSQQPRVSVRVNPPTYQPA